MVYVIERAPDVFEGINGAFQSGNDHDAVNHPVEWLELSIARRSASTWWSRRRCPRV